jgi:hypothetical protein
MALSIVNGYLCFCSCDEAKAKKGENPHPSTDPNKIEADKKNKAARLGAAQDPAVIFGGKLSGVTRTDVVKPAGDAQPNDSAVAQTQNLKIDILA